MIWGFGVKDYFINIYFYVFIYSGYWMFLVKRILDMNVYFDVEIVFLMQSKFLKMIELVYG